MKSNRQPDLTADCKSVLIFCVSVDHCQHVARKIQEFSGKECAIVTGETSPIERGEIIDRFKGETVSTDLLGASKPPLKFLANDGYLAMPEKITVKSVAGERFEPIVGWKLQPRPARLSDKSPEYDEVPF